jgi:DNA-binding GntR family transcriptional regulator
MMTEIAASVQDVTLERPVSVVEGVYDRIYQRLMSLVVAPGARLPIDVIARELNTSQTPVREALSRLEREGLVRKAHLIGYSAAPQLTLKQFDDLYQFRLALEPLAARHATDNMTGEQLAALERAASEMANSPPSLDRKSRYSRFAQADAQFHDAILRVAGNEVVRHALSGQHIHLHLFRLMFHARVTEEALDEHAAIMAAFGMRDVDAAEGAMRRHIMRSYDRLRPVFD